MATIWHSSSSPELLNVFLHANRPEELVGSHSIEVRSGRSSGPVGPKEINKNSEKVIQAKKLLEKATKELKELNKEESPVEEEEKPAKRAQIKGEFLENVQKLAQSAGLTCGKWILFFPKRNVGGLFNKIARNVVSGDLSKLSQSNCHSVKVFNSPSIGRGQAEGKVIEIFFDDVWNEEHAKEVLKTIIPYGNTYNAICKPDLFTVINLKQGHASKISPTLYLARELGPKIKKEASPQDEEEEDDDDDEEEVDYNRWKAMTLNSDPPIQRSAPSSASNSEIDAQAQVENQPPPPPPPQAQPQMSTPIKASRNASVQAKLAIDSEKTLENAKKVLGESSKNKNGKKRGVDELDGDGDEPEGSNTKVTKKGRGLVVENDAEKTPRRSGRAAKA